MLKPLRINKTRLEDGQAFDEWVSLARKGDTAIYHRGYLVRDRLESSELTEVAETAFEHHKKGRVRLFQKREGDFDYLYVVERA